MSQDRFADRLALEPIDRDIFTGRCHSGSPLRAYGGQIAAQALMAAGSTVDAPDRQVHSLHGYFLRPGHTKETITYLVERPRDGGSFSTRVVRAVQHGETIFLMTASFAVVDPGPEHQFAAPRVGSPDDATMPTTSATSFGPTVASRSTGLLVAAARGTRSRIRDRSSLLSVGTCIPTASAASAARINGPPELPMSASRGPTGAD